MPKKRTYFRVRRIAAAELLRLREAGHQVNAEAVEWATDTLNAIDNNGGRPLLVDRGPIIEFLGQHPLAGVSIDEVATATKINLKTCTSILYNLRKLGQIGCVKIGGRVLYFVTPAAAEEAKPALMKTQQLVYEARRQASNAANGTKKRKAKTIVLQPPKHSQAAERAAKSFDRPTSPPSLPPPPPPALPLSSPLPLQVPDTRVTKSRLKAPPAPPVVVDHPNGVKREVLPTRRELIDRFGAVDPTATVPGGFREEFQRLRAGGASS